MEHSSVVSDWRDAQADLAANRARLFENRAVLRSHVERLSLTCRGGADLRESAIARLRARLETQPVIEQAKGILIARTGCSPDEAFMVLRRASQRTNSKVRDLAARIVADAQSRTDSGLPARGIPSPSTAPRSTAVSLSRNGSHLTSTWRGWSERVGGSGPTVDVAGPQRADIDP